MPEETLFEFESPQTRAEIAGRLRSLADGLNNGGPLTLAADDRSVTVTPPDSPEFELEVEREWDDEDEDGTKDGEPDEVSTEIEIEIEWSESDKTAETDPEADTNTASDSEDGDEDTDAGERASAEDDSEEVAAPIDPDQADVPDVAAGGIGTASHRVSSNSTSIAAASGAGGSSTATATSSPPAVRAMPRDRRPNRECVA
jgi:amphi-Trp domain-containing protein